jgi:hypothetical protein
MQIQIFPGRLYTQGKFKGMARNTKHQKEECMRDLIGAGCALRRFSLRGTVQPLQKDLSMMFLSWLLDVFAMATS